MEIENTPKITLKENTQKRYLIENINILENSDYLIILDFFHLNSDNNEEVIKKYLVNLKEICFIDLKISYLIFMKSWMLEDKVNVSENFQNFLSEIFTQNKNVFYEDKLTNVHLISGFSLAKNMTVYIFSDESNGQFSFTKFTNKYYEKYFKFSNFEFFKVTLDYMLREKKRKYEQTYGKKQTKLSILLSDQEATYKNEYSKNQITNDNTDSIRSSITSNYNFQQIYNSILNYFANSPPNTFQIIKNVILNFAEQNSNYFYKNFSLKEADLSFIIFSELLEKEVIINNILRDLILSNKITNFEDIDSLISFYVNPTYIKNDSNKEVTKIHKKKSQNKRKKVPPNLMNFSISENAEELYTNLIQNSIPICNYVKNVVYRILSSISFNTIERLPTNPTRYKNYIYAFVNNQELLKIAKKILIIEYDKILNILTEGIIIEFMRNNLVIIMSNKKIYYNINEIEKEKFRLYQLNSEVVEHK